jgi:hypothetical protein
MSTANSERRKLISILRAGEPQLSHRATRLRAAYDTYGSRDGAKTGLVARDLRALEQALSQELGRVKQTDIHSTRALKAKNLVIQTLTLMRATFESLHEAQKGTSQQRKMALQQAQHHLSEAQQLQKKASRALNYGWQL